MDGEIIEKLNDLKKEVNKIRNFDDMFPEDTGSIHVLIHWIAYFIHPEWEDLDSMTATYGIQLNNDEKKKIYPSIINFIKFVKGKFLTA